jgi:uncharacterized protein with HEPN domain
MPRDYKLYLRDIVSAARFIEGHIADLTFEEFESDDLRLNAVLFSLSIIGEAVKHIPEEIRARMPEIPWQEIAGVRDIIVHGYFALKLPVIWHAVQTEVPLLRQQIERLLEELER